MADLEFNTASGQTVDRELLIAYLNTGTTSAPVWSPLGRRDGNVHGTAVRSIQKTIYEVK